MTLSNPFLQDNDEREGDAQEEGETEQQEDTKSGSPQKPGGPSEDASPVVRDLEAITLHHANLFPSTPTLTEDSPA